MSALTAQPPSPSIPYGVTMFAQPAGPASHPAPGPVTESTLGTAGVAAVLLLVAVTLAVALGLFLLMALGKISISDTQGRHRDHDETRASRIVRPKRFKLLSIASEIPTRCKGYGKWHDAEAAPAASTNNHSTWRCRI